ncbi:TonB-dependent receptor domain-containing protein [Roseivirga sp. E12]|uniref:TonB-dependent receptor domain-containing protein n=1 Tax=Roseivirga sp. E12 TaxID=2819237 RepID=UPI001ABC7FDF|nr:TonB-dependent receptor [Roseivirga sp. E12]
MRFIYCLFLGLITTWLVAQDINTLRITERFDDVSLAKVIRTLRNKYDIKIAYDDALITGIIIDGAYTQLTLPNFLDNILKDKGIDYQILNGKIILIPKQVNLDITTPSLFDLTVFGSVQDANTGENLPNALVRVRGESRGTVTNKDGYFVLPQVPNDTSTIEISYLGYKKAEIKLIPGNTRKTLQILMEESIVELSDFVVVENQRKTVRYGDEISQMTIDPRNLAALPSLGEFDVFRSLQLLPGIGGTNETSSALTIRNSPSAHNLVLFDGFNIYRLDHFFGVYSAINSDAIRDIQIYKGGFGAKYGGRIAGVVDMTGNTGSFKEPSYSLGVNLLSARFSVNTPLNEGRGALHISARRAYTDIIRSKLFENLYRNFREESNDIEGINANDVLRPDFHFYDINAKASYNVSYRDLLSLTLYNGQDNLDANFEAIERGPNNNIRSIQEVQEMANWGNTGVGLVWSRKWNRNFNSSLQFAYSDHFYQYNYSDTTKDGNGLARRFNDLDRRNDVEDYQVNLRNEIFVGKRHRIDFGTNYSDLNVNSQLMINERNRLTGRLFNGSGSIFSIYASDKFYITPKLLLNPGLRYNISSLSDESFLSHRFGLIYQVTPEFELKASTGNYYQIIREQNFDDPFTNAQDGWILADQDPSRSGSQFSVLESDHWIAGFQYEKNNLTFDVEFYKKTVTGLSENIVSYVVNPNTNVRRAQIVDALGTSDIVGIDFLVQKEIGPYQGWISYTRSKATNQFDVINAGTEIPSREDQRNELKLVNIVELPEWNIAATWTYGSGKPFLEPQINFIRNNLNEVVNFEVINTNKTITRLPAYHRLDISVARKFENEYMKGELGLSILNVYNRLNVQSRRLNREALESFIDQDPGGTLPTNIYRNIALLDLTPSIFLNLYF